MVWRAGAARRILATPAQICVSPRAGQLAARLDCGLYTRPLPDRLVLVGRDRSCSAAVIADLATSLRRSPELVAVTVGAPVVSSLGELVDLGAAFRGGPVCQAGGFGGDACGPVQDRLAALGFVYAQVHASHGETVGDPSAWHVRQPA